MKKYLLRFVLIQVAIISPMTRTTLCLDDMNGSAKSITFYVTMVEI